jgi:Fe-S-cluster containining protein
VVTPSTPIVAEATKRLPVIPLPVDPHWKCQRSGDCCTKPLEVVMTTQEAAAIVHAAPKEIAMHFRPAGGDFVALKAAPCPLFAFNTCLVYAVRPYNCRRFGCMRPDVQAEPFEPDGGNLMKRVQQSRTARRLAERMQRKAQGWAQKMGWPIT